MYIKQSGLYIASFLIFIRASAHVGVLLLYLTQLLNHLIKQLNLPLEILLQIIMIHQLEDLQQFTIPLHLFPFKPQIVAELP